MTEVGRACIFNVGDLNLLFSLSKVVVEVDCIKLNSLADKSSDRGGSRALGRGGGKTEKWVDGLERAAGEGAGAAKVSSTREFHAPQTGQRPSHLGLWASHSVQTYIFFGAFIIECSFLYIFPLYIVTEEPPVCKKKTDGAK